jgi:nucleotide-binding universal stress UspA family protein
VEKANLPFSRILLATQGTEFDVGAERVAIDLCARFGVPLSAVLPVVSNPEYESLAPLLENKAEAEAAAKLKGLRETARARGVEMRARVRTGEEPYREIIDEALECRADLIVLRRRGRRSFLANLLLGEMVHTVIGHAPCHVLIVPRASNLWARSILLATDGSLHSQRSSHVAASIAAASELPLIVASVAEPQSGDADTASENVKQALAWVRAAHADVKGLVLTGRPHEAIVNASTDRGADLIVVGRRGNALRKILLGSTAEQVAGHSKCAVLIVDGGRQP